MRDKINNFFSGRQGMDEFSKALFWAGLILLLLSSFMGGFLNGVPGAFIRWIGLFMLIYCFVRAFSKRRSQRDAENYVYLNFIARQKNKYAAYKDRRAQRKDFKFFKCPGCGTMIRVPKGKGKIHIKCKCGYTLYRKT